MRDGRRPAVQQRGTARFQRKETLRPPPLCCTAGRLRSDTRLGECGQRHAGGAAGMTGVSGEERMNASMGEVCGLEDCYGDNRV
ncbi:hypothetical protein DXD21_14070, partial [Blautia sp. TF12-12AT]